MAHSFDQAVRVIACATGERLHVVGMRTGTVTPLPARTPPGVDLLTQELTFIRAALGIARSAGAGCPPQWIPGLPGGLRRPRPSGRR